MSVSNSYSDQLISTSQYLVRLSKTERDLRMAQSLRYRVFNLELGEGLPESHNTKRDVDKFDRQCDHLLVVERNTGSVIGTYRMQTYEKAHQHQGLYTANEFDLSKLPKDLLDESVEVGRACIDKDHRNGRVLYLLWRGIAQYLKITQSRYLFGCCSITSTDPACGWIVMDYLQEKELLHSDFKLDTKPEFDCPKVSYAEESWKDVELPQLFKLYIELGAKVLSNPALDSTFKTIDFLVLVDIMQLDERSKALFLR